MEVKKFINTGFFIAFEGGDRTGKTTQIAYAKNYLESLGFSVVVTKEPGDGDPIGYQKLVAYDSIVSPEEELRLFCKDRRIHIKRLIRPSLKKKQIVLCDRFEPSTIAYQGYGHGLPLSLIREQSAIARDTIWPDLILLFDAEPALVLKRTDPKSRFDALSLDFHNRVRAGFIQQAISEPRGWRIINATEPPDIVRGHVERHINTLLWTRALEYFRPIPTIKKVKYRTSLDRQLLN
jgi:dTMP kinase